MSQALTTTRPTPVAAPVWSSDLPLLQLRDVAVHYGAHAALQGVDLTLWRGDRVALVGPNGAGKTTLLRVALGLIAPTHGERILSAPQPTIGYVPQHLHFDPRFPLTVEEFLAINQPGSLAWFGGVPRRHRVAFDEALLQTGTLGLARQRLGACSGGELQRVLIAAALLQKPQLLVLDEPSANIDRRGVDTLCTLLQNLHATLGLTLLFVSHDLHFVAALSDRVACLNGELCGLGSPQEMLDEHFLAEVYGDAFAPGRPRFQPKESVA